MGMKLSQIVAVEASEKAQVTRLVTDIYKTLEKPALFSGQTRVFRPLSDEDAAKKLYPDENTTVQSQVNTIMGQAFTAWAKKLDITLTKDVANATAKANIVVNGNTIAKDVPATHLLWLQKELTDVQTFIKKLPVLDPAVVWTKDTNDGLMKTAELSTVKTKKTNKVVIMVPPTDKHPGQSQLVTEDVAEGHWITVRLSGALSQSDKTLLEGRIHELQTAVKVALWEANSTEAPNQNIGAALLAYVQHGK